MVVPSPYIPQRENVDTLDRMIEYYEHRLKMIRMLKQVVRSDVNEDRKITKALQAVNGW